MFKLFDPSRILNDIQNSHLMFSSEAAIVGWSVEFDENENNVFPITWQMVRDFDTRCANLNFFPQEEVSDLRATFSEMLPNLKLYNSQAFSCIKLIPDNNEITHYFLVYYVWDLQKPIGLHKIQPSDSQLHKTLEMMAWGKILGNSFLDEIATWDNERLVESIYYFASKFTDKMRKQMTNLVDNRGVDVEPILMNYRTELERSVYLKYRKIKNPFFFWSLVETVGYLCAIGSALWCFYETIYLIAPGAFSVNIFGKFLSALVLSISFFVASIIRGKIRKKANSLKRCPKCGGELAFVTDYNIRYAIDFTICEKCKIFVENRDLKVETVTVTV